MSALSPRQMLNRMLGRLLDFLGKQRPLTCLNCGYRIHRDERVPRRSRGADMGRRGWVHWTTFHEHANHTDGSTT